MCKYMDFLDGLEKCQVIIYRRPDFLADDFEYESYMGQSILRNIFKEYRIDTNTTGIFLSFPERWLNCVQHHHPFPRLAAYYPNLKTLQIKTHAPLIISNTPNKYAFMLPEEDEITRSCNGSVGIGELMSIEDPCAVFKEISKCKIFCNNEVLS